MCPRTTVKSPSIAKGHSRIAGLGPKKARTTSSRRGPTPTRKTVKRAPVPPEPQPPPPLEAESTAEGAPLAQEIAAILDAKHGQDIVIIDVASLTSYTNFLVLASGASDRQVKALSDYVMTEMVASHRRRPLGTEGQATAEWLLIDFGEVIVHLFSPEARLRYDLEGFWREAPRLQVSPPTVPSARARPPRGSRTPSPV